MANRWQSSALNGAGVPKDRKALKFLAHVRLALTSSLQDEGLLSGEGAAVENTKGSSMSPQS